MWSVLFPGPAKIMKITKKKREFAIPQSKPPLFVMSVLVKQAYPVKTTNIPPVVAAAYHIVSIL